MLFRLKRSKRENIQHTDYLNCFIETAILVNIAVSIKQKLAKLLFVNSNLNLASLKKMISSKKPIVSDLLSCSSV